MDRPFLGVDFDDVSVDLDVSLGEIGDDACVVIALVPTYG